MPTDSKAKRSRKATPPSTPASNASADQPLTGGRLRRVLLLVGLVIIAVGIWPAWRRAACAYYLSATREAMERREFDQARDAVRVAERYSPNSAEAHFLKAVVARRGGQLSVVEDSLRRAEELGWPTADIHLQRLLLSAQVGRVDDVEEQLRALLMGDSVDDSSALQVYESLAHGFWMNHRVNDVLQLLDFWIKWRPTDIEPRLMRADVFNEFSDPVSAEKDYTQILEFAPNHALAREMLGQLLLARGQVEAAAEHFRYGAATGTPSTAVLAGLAECEFRSGRPDEARSWLDKIDFDSLEVERRAKTWKLLADIQRFQGDQQGAVETLERAVAIWPHDSGILQSLGQCYAAIGKRELAEKHLEQSKEITQRAEHYLELKRSVVRRPNDAELRYEIGRTLQKQSLPEEAANWWRSAVRCDWTHQPSHEALADFYAQQGKTELEKKFRLSAHAAVGTTFQRAWGAFSRGEVSRARELDDFLAKYPEVAPQHELLQVAFLVRDGKLDAAAPRLAALLKSPVLRHFALTLEAEALLAQGLVKDAEARLKGALELAPDDLGAHRMMAVLYYDLGAVDACEGHLLKVAEGDPADYRMFRLLGLMSKDFENYQDAIDRYQWCLQRNPPKNVREEVLLELAECLIRQRSYDDALTALSDASPSPERDTMQAECLYNQGKTDEAVTVLDGVLEKKPDHASALSLRGDAALVAEKPEQAIDFYQRAVAADPFEHTTHTKLAQAFSRAGQEEKSAKAHDRSEELKQLRKRFAKLHEEAAAKPYDAKLRREMAQTAEFLGRKDLAQVWTKAADSLDPPEASKDEPAK